MFAITSTRITGLIAFICAVVIAPQALAASSTHSVVPLEPVQGADMSGVDLKAGFESQATSRIAPTDGAQGLDLSGFDLKAGFKSKASSRIAAGSRKSVKATTTSAAIAALMRRSVALDAAYRKLYPDAYRQTVQQSVRAAAWSFPAFCNGQADAEYDYIHSECKG